MSGTNEKTISMCQGKGSLSHDNREFTAENVDPNRTGDNITFVREDLSEAYRKCFDEAVEKYNSTQKRSDRKIKDGYFQHLFAGREPSKSKSVLTGTNKQKSFYEDLVQIGTKDDTGCGTADASTVKECLTEYMNGFQERNPNFYVFNAVMHLDEATPHLHIDYIPLGHFDKGIRTRNAMAKALEEMGYGKGKDAVSRWRESEYEVLKKICENHGIAVSKPKKSRGYSYTVEEYKKYKDEIQSLKEEKQQAEEETEQAQTELNDTKGKKAELFKKLKESYEREKNIAYDVEFKMNDYISELKELLSKNPVYIYSHRDEINRTLSNIAKCGKKFHNIAYKSEVFAYEVVEKNNKQYEEITEANETIKKKDKTISNYEAELESLKPSKEQLNRIIHALDDLGLTGTVNDRIEANAKAEKACQEQLSRSQAKNKRKRSTWER